LYWWQWVTAQRLYEVDAAGDWVHHLGWVSVSRQSGKSEYLTADACWHSDRLPDELTIHTANTVTGARGVQQRAWPWAERQGYRVDRLLGESQIHFPNGSRWLTIAMSAAFGRSPSRLLIDEAWRASGSGPRSFWDALYPSLGAHDNAQALFFSAANAGEMGLARELRGREDVARCEWGALPGEDHMDPAVWRASSPYWNRGRQRLMAAAAGSPSFAENWLNVWPDEAGADGGLWLDRAGWDSGRLPSVAPTGPVVCALDSTPDGLRFAAVAVWMADGRMHVSASSYFEHRGEALAWVERFRPKVMLVGIGLVPLLPRLRWPVVGFGTRETALGTGPFAALVRDGSVMHDGALDDEVYGAVAEHRSGAGLVLAPRRSPIEVSRLKLALWACWHAERNDSVFRRERLRIL